MEAHTRTDTQTHTSKEDSFVELINISMDEYKNTSRKVSPSSPAPARGERKACLFCALMSENAINLHNINKNGLDQVKSCSYFVLPIDIKIQQHRSLQNVQKLSAQFDLHLLQRSVSELLYIKCFSCI